MSLLIVLAAVYFAALLSVLTFTAFRGAAAGITTLTLFALAVMLARNGNDFGLFKLYMYAQPFVAATIAVFVSGLKKRPALLLVTTLAVCVVTLQLPTLNDYVRRSFNPVDLPKRLRARPPSSVPGDGRESRSSTSLS